jgi:peptide deformylase
MAMRKPQILEVVTVDSPRAGVLRRRAKPVGKVTPAIQRLIDAMVATMEAANGLGLAAPQVGEGKRVLVAEVEERLVMLVDPVVSQAEGEEVAQEACLSVPGVLAPVRRAVRVTVKGKNRKGRGITVRAEGLLARVLQHEIDHLDGILFLDRVEDPSTIERVGTEAPPLEVAAAVE